MFDDEPTLARPVRVSTRPISVVLRAVPRKLLEGEIAGHVEVVATGESFAVRGTEEFVALLARLADEDY